MGHKENILRLLSEGKTYRQIKEELGCSKATIAYHSSSLQKEKCHIRNNNNRKKQKSTLEGKLTYSIFKIVSTKVNKTIRNTEADRGVDYIKRKKEIKQFVTNIIEKPICYLSGRIIDLSQTGTYHFDHIIPISKGGLNDISNIGLTTREANVAKGDLNIDQLISLCKDILQCHVVELEDTPTGLVGTELSE